MRATRTALLMAGWLGADACAGPPKPEPATPRASPDAPSPGKYWANCYWVRMNENDSATAAATGDSIIVWLKKSPDDTAHMPLLTCVVLTAAKDTAHQP